MPTLWFRVRAFGIGLDESASFSEIRHECGARHMYGGYARLLGGRKISVVEILENLTGCLQARLVRRRGMRSMGWSCITAAFAQQA